MQGARFDPKPSQVGEKDKKKEEKREKKNCGRSGILTHDPQISHPELNSLG